MKNMNHFRFNICIFLAIIIVAVFCSSCTEYKLPEYELPEIDIPEFEIPTGDYTVPEESVDLTESNSGESETEPEESQTIPETEPTEAVVKYADDPIIDRFISDFNSKSNLEMTNISKGNIITKYHASVNECFIEMINANEQLAEYFSVLIKGGQDESSKERVLEVFAEMLKVLDPTLTDDKITEAVDYLKSQQHMVNDYDINDNLRVETYVPIIELSSGKTDCKIKLAASNYK